MTNVIPDIGVDATATVAAVAASLGQVLGFVMGFGLAVYLGWRLRAWLTFVR